MACSRRMINTMIRLFRVCEEEEAEEPIEHRIHQSDEYYQDRVRVPRFTSEGEMLRDPPKYDIDESVTSIVRWCVRHSSSPLQILVRHARTSNAIHHSNHSLQLDRLLWPMAFELHPSISSSISSGTRRFRTYAARHRYGRARLPEGCLLRIIDSTHSVSRRRHAAHAE